MASAGLTPNHSNRISYIFDCPRCSKKNKLYIRRRDGHFCCFACRQANSFYGQAEHAFAALLHLPVWEVRAALRGDDHQAIVSLDLRFGDFFDDDFIDPEADEVPSVAWPFDYIPIDAPQAHRGLAYLEGRGISLALAKTYDLRYCVKERRVIFPIKVGGRLVGWQKRLIVQDSYWNEEEGRTVGVPKILSSIGIPRDQTLMFADALIGLDHAVLTEGPVDAIKAHLCGGNVATMGKTISSSQLALLRHHGLRRLYLALDLDAAFETTRLLREMSDIECYLMTPPPGQDLGSMTPEAVYELFQAAPRVQPGTILTYFKRIP